MAPLTKNVEDLASRALAPIRKYFCGIAKKGNDSIRALNNHFGAFKISSKAIVTSDDREKFRITKTHSILFSNKVRYDKEEIIKLFRPAFYACPVDLNNYIVQLF